MRDIVIPARVGYNELTQEFVEITKETKITIEHSLISISKWESKWHKAFLGDQEKSDEELIDYIRCMTITPNVDPNVYYSLTPENYDEITNYIKDPMSATYVRSLDEPNGPKDTMTSELIYYYIITLNIPVEFQKWHLNRLLKLIEVCNIKNSAGKLNKKAISKQNAKINAERWAAYQNSRG